MADRKKLIASAMAATALALGGGGIAYATGDDAEEQATGPNVDRAKSAALDHTNGGQVTGAEVGDEEGYYEIEVTRDDGSQTDVHLDRDLNVLGSLADRENANDEDGPNDD